MPGLLALAFVAAGGAMKPADAATYVYVANAQSNDIDVPKPRSIPPIRYIATERRPTLISPVSVMPGSSRKLAVAWFWTGPDSRAAMISR